MNKIIVCFLFCICGFSSVVSAAVSPQAKKEAVLCLERRLENLRPLHLEAQGLIDDGQMTVEKMERFLQILEQYALGKEGLKDSVAAFENELDVENDDESREGNRILEGVLVKERQSICEQALGLLKEGASAQKEKDRENVALCFTGLMEVAGQFNSTLAFHCVPHSVEVAILSARSAEPDGFSGMFEAAAEGAYHDSRMTYLKPEGKKRKIGIESTDCEGASGDALIVQLELLRGSSLSKAEREERKKKINRTVPCFATIDPKISLGAVTNETMLDIDIGAIFIRRDVGTHEYKEKEGLSRHLEELSYSYYDDEPISIESSLKTIEHLLFLQSEFRVGQADLSEILVHPRRALEAGSFALWIESFPKEAYALLNLGKGNKIEKEKKSVEMAMKSLRAWIAMQKFFVRGTVTFREECNYYPLLAMQEALCRMGKVVKGSLRERVCVLLERVKREVMTFEGLYCVSQEENSGEWKVKKVRSEGYHQACMLERWVEKASAEEIAEKLRQYYCARTGRVSPPHPRVMEAFVSERLRD